MTNFLVQRLRLRRTWVTPRVGLDQNASILIENVLRHAGGSAGRKRAQPSGKPTIDIPGDDGPRRRIPGNTTMIRNFKYHRK